MNSDEMDLQKSYYTNTASEYDHQHLLDKDEHFLALNYLQGLINFHGFTSILDVAL